MLPFPMYFKVHHSSFPKIATARIRKPIQKKKNYSITLPGHILLILLPTILISPLFLVPKHLVRGISNRNTQEIHRKTYKTTTYL